MVSRNGKNQNGEISHITPDNIYYDEEASVLSFDGHVHLHWLMAKDIQLKKISHEWDGMPVVMEKEKRKVMVSPKVLSDEVESKREVPQQMRKGHGNPKKLEVTHSCVDRENSSAPQLMGWKDGLASISEI